MSLFDFLSSTVRRSPREKNRRRRRPRRSVRANPRLESLERRELFATMAMDLGDTEVLACHAETETREVEFVPLESVTRSESSVAPVLMVIANRDFHHREYFETRESLEAAGLEVIVAAATTETATPHAISVVEGREPHVTPDIALSDVKAEDYSAIVFTGGWGMAQYQYGFEGTYHNSAYNGDAATREVVNDLINEFVEQDKHVAAVCYGVSVLAYARVDGSSLLEGRTVTGWNGAAPASDAERQSSRDQIEDNGATMVSSGSIGDPRTATDDVFVEGKIITAENYDSASLFGDTIAQALLSEATESDGPRPVLMVIANQDFYHREYYETRESLEAAGLEVVVAAATTETATPHAISVVEGREPHVTPDIALSDVKAEDYSAIVFVGGYGAASYQYANESTYDNPVYEGRDDVKATVNDLINDFVEQDKHVTAICNGVSVLAWARVDGESLLEGHTVTAWAHTLPSADGGVEQLTRDQIEANGATMVASGSIGDPRTATDDVYIDGKIITAENYDSAHRFGEVIAEQLLGRS